MTDGCAAGSARLASATGLRVLAGLRPPLTPVGRARAYRIQEGDGVALDETTKGGDASEHHRTGCGIT